MTAERVEGTFVPHGAPSSALARLVVVPTARPVGLYERKFKRALDLAIALMALVVVAPVLLVVGTLVLVSMGRPVLFRQQRVGKDGEVFTVLKFRTMHGDRRASAVGAWDGQDRRLTHKTVHDPRHTPVGRVLRMLSLDELPQLWNVLRGDMSIVGPRPELVHIVAGYQAWQHRRHHVRPGLTGRWQVSARGAVPMHEATQVDLAYVDELSFRSDLRILLSTPAAVLRRTGS